MLNKKIIITIFSAMVLGGLMFSFPGLSRSPSFSETENGIAFLPDEEVEKDFENGIPEEQLLKWQRPEGPIKVALQAGHYKAYEAPDEFPNLKTNTGTRGGGKAEWQVNLEIAKKTKALLEKSFPEIVVEILPATIPPGYLADVFVAIHADGNANSRINGYKVAAPRRDATGRAQNFANLLSEEYRKITKLKEDPNITRNMRGYYAFNWRKYTHALHPQTVGVIIETGFLTSPNDRRIIVSNQNKSATGIANAITKFLYPD